MQTPSVRFLLAILIAFLLGAPPADALDPTRKIAQFHHTAWTVQEGMPASVRSIVQTDDGFLWLGTGSGLYRFDGHRAERIEKIGSARLPRTEIHSVALSSDGDIWIGYAGSVTVISRIRNGVLTNYTQADGLPGNGVTQIVPDNNGGVWMRSNGDASGALPDRLAWFDGETWRIIDGDWGSMVQNIRAGVVDFIVGPDDTVWVRNSTGLYYYRAGMPKFEAAPNFTARLYFFARDSQGALWTSDWGSQRFYTLPDLSRGVEHISAPNFKGDAPRSNFRSVQIDRNGSIWWIPFGGGIARLPSLTETPLPELDTFRISDGLSSDTAITVYEDREGNIWVGTEGGLDRFRAADVVRDPRIALTWIVNSAQLASTEDALFVYTGQAREPFRSIDDASAIFRIGADGVPQRVAEDVGDVSEFASENADLFFTSTSSRGGAERLRYRLRGGVELEIVPFPPTAPPDNNIGPILVADGYSWYARPGSGFYRYKDGVESQIIAKADAAPTPKAWFWRGRVCVLYTDGVLYEISGDVVRQQPLPDIGESKFLTKSERRVLFASEQAILDWDGERFRALSTTRNPDMRVISDAAITSDGGIWMATPAGIVHTSEGALEAALDAGNDTLSYRLFGMEDGLAAATSGQIEEAPDGRVWFTTVKGVAWIDPARLAHNDIPPPVEITRLSVGDRVYDMPGDLRLDPGSSSLEIDFVALSLAIPERNRFRYKLIGVDGDWIDAGSRRQAFYTRLGPGQYEFKVIAANNDGVWNMEGATLRFDIAPTFLQSIWFKFFVVLAVCGVIWGAFVFRLRLAKAQIQNRFHIQIAERERIARELHDTLLQSVQGTMLRFQAAANSMPPDSDARAKVDDALDRADLVLVEARERVRNLRATSINGGLTETIAGIAQTMIDGDAPRLTITEEGAPRSLRTLMNDEILRIAEEAIRNAVKHANANTISVSLIFGKERLSLSVWDDGDGIPDSILNAGEKPGHYGLIGMRERAARIGGRLNIASREGAGVELTLTVPAKAAYSDYRAPFGHWFK